MKEEHVLVIDGNDSTTVSLLRGRLLSTQSLYEYSTVIWVVDGIVAELAAYQPQQRILLDNDLNGRLWQIREWVVEGHNFILVGPTAQALYRPHSSGAMITASVQDSFPLALLKKVTASGTRIEVVGGIAADSVLQPFLEQMSYRCTLAGKGLVPLLFAHRATPGDKSVVGGYINVGKGRVFFIPNGRAPNDKNDTFYRALAKLPHSTQANREELPAWTSFFQSKNEAEILNRVAELNAKRQEIDNLIVEQEIKLSDEGTLKHLISGTGSGFTSAVSAALTEIGFTITEGPNSRADLIGICENRCFAIEAKGIDGSVRERQYRQVDRWMAELNNALHSDPEDIKGDPEIAKYAECVAQMLPNHCDGNDAKGLLVVGTFRQTPLDERTEADFPDTVARLLQRTDTCGMTGLQLFGLVMEVRADPSMKPIISKEIIETRGVLGRCKNWTTFLSKVPA